MTGIQVPRIQQDVTEALHGQIMVELGSVGISQVLLEMKMSDLMTTYGASLAIEWGVYVSGTSLASGVSHIPLTIDPSIFIRFRGKSSCIWRLWSWKLWSLNPSRRRRDPLQGTDVIKEVFEAAVGLLLVSRVKVLRPSDAPGSPCKVVFASSKAGRFLTSGSSATPRCIV
jgi:hypothetical protein